MRNVVSMLLLFFVIASNSAHSQWKYLNGFSGPVISIGGYDDTVFVSAASLGGLDSSKVYRSSDYGLTWTRVDQTMPNDGINTVQSFVQIDTNFYAGMTAKGVQRSTDAGKTWHQTTNFYNPADAFALGRRGDSLLVGYYNVAWSTNAGATWAHGTFGHPASITLSVLSVGDKLFTTSSGVSRSTDGGLNWGPVNTGLPITDVYYLTSLGSILFVNIPGYGVYRTTNSGSSWQRVNNGMLADSLTVNALTSSPPYVFAGTQEDVYVSRDSGKSWQSTGYQNFVQVGTLKVVGPYLYAGSLYRHALADFYPAAKIQKVITTTGSYSFNDSTGATGVTLDIFSLTGATVLTVSRYTGAPVNPTYVSFIPSYLSDYRWVIDAPAGFSGTADIRISLSAFSTGISNPNDVTIYKRSTSGTGGFTHIGTTYDENTNEIFGTVTSFSEFAFGSNSEPLGVTSVDPNMPVTTSLAQNYPNPFNPTTQIAFDLAVQSTVRLTVYNVLGVKVATLVDGIEPAGHRNVSWNASGVPSGIYFYKLEAVGTAQRGGSFTQIKKMILLK